MSQYLMKMSGSVWSLLILNIWQTFYAFVWANNREEFEDTKGVIRSRKLKKDRQHNGQNKKDKCPNNLQNIA